MAVETPGKQEQQRLFEQWALPHKDQLYTACLYLTRQREEAEDLFQETYLRAFRFIHQFTPGTNCRAWLLTIMHNAFRNRYAQHQRDVRTVALDGAERADQQQRIVDGAAPLSDPAEIVLSRMVDQEILDALRALPEEYRSALLLVDIEELTYEEASAVLHCPLGTVRSRLSRARRLLHATLTSYGVARGYLKKSDAAPCKAEDEL
jgi:RNA polymerase sigma-70 factor, ECF subfamily